METARAVQVPSCNYCPTPPATNHLCADGQTDRGSQTVCQRLILAMQKYRDSMARHGRSACQRHVQRPGLRFALQDTLLEAGHSDLAEHFRNKDHPKGAGWWICCWGRSEAMTEAE